MAETRNSKWNELLANGGADTFFESYLDNNELAEQVNNMFRKYSGVITVEQLAKDRKRFSESPRRGDERKEQLASPTKHVILNKSRQLNIYEALAEIIDNIFDNYERNPNRHRALDIRLDAHPPVASRPAEIMISENSGGIPSERIGPLIQLGASDRSSGSIGAWGEGFKMAVFALGNEVEIFSSFPDEPPVAIHFPNGWLDQNSPRWTQWKVGIYEIEANHPTTGSTIIRINHLHKDTLSTLGLDGEEVKSVSEITDYFGEVYSEKYHNLREEGYDVSIRISVAGDEGEVKFLDGVEERLSKHLAFIPWLKPIVWDRTWRTNLEVEGRDAVLKATIYAGLAATEGYSPSYSSQLSKPGIEMWGNGRKFSLKGRITDESVGWGYTFGGKGGKNPTSNASYRRLTIVVKFSASDSRDVPWAAPVKNDYNRRSEFYAEIQDSLARVIRLYKNAHTLLESALMPFSVSWQDLNVEDKFSILFRDVDVTSKEKTEFLDSRFGKKVLSYSPVISFQKIPPDEDTPTSHSLFGLPPADIQKIVKAAAVSKDSYADRVTFLKAILPNLANQAEIEERLKLHSNEELHF